MPYISENKRKKLDTAINSLVLALKTNINDGNPFEKTTISKEEVLDICGDINYCFSRIIGYFVNNETSYGKIAILTGVLENIKQELYRRVASVYEDQKILSEGDIQEYKKYS